MRYVVIGLGNIGERRRRLLGRRCVATVDPVNPAADYGSAEDLCDVDYDAAVVATPNRVKLDLLRRLLADGKHVLVEKPLLFSDLETSTALAAVAGANGAIWYTSYNHRFEPLIVKLKQRLAEGAIGDFYHGRLVYGNGTVRNLAGTWRDGGFGVVEDLGCHLVDLADQLFGVASPDYSLLGASRFESASIDHCTFATTDRRLAFECASTMWKNAFTIDAYGSRGSLHLSGLRKWGPVVLAFRERTFPSGVPTECLERDEGPDDSWDEDVREFERCARAGITSQRTDVLVSAAVTSLGTASLAELK